MNLATLTSIKFKRIITRRKLINLSWVLLLLGVIVVGYFLGTKVPKLYWTALISRIPSEEKLGQVPIGIEKMEKKEAVLPTKTNYEETAEPGEGITHLARKALKEYLKEKGQTLNLTAEHKIYIEDYLQKKTGNYWLQVGQKISFSEDLIKEAIDQAQQLTSQQLQNLTQYSQLVPELNY